MQGSDSLNGVGLAILASGREPVATAVIPCAVAVAMRDEVAEITVIRRIFPKA